MIILTFQFFFLLTYCAPPPQICFEPSASSQFLDVVISKAWNSNYPVNQVPAVIDVNGDSKSDIIFVAETTTVNPKKCSVFALSGVNLTVLWEYTNTTLNPYAYGDVAVANTQNGGLICFPSLPNNLTCLNFSGHHLFTVKLPMGVVNSSSYTVLGRGIPTSIISVDGTKQPFIISGSSMFNSSGHMIWAVSDIEYNHTFVISDLNNDGLLELVYPDRILNAIDGSTFEFFNHSVYSTFDATNGSNIYNRFVGIADFDGDGYGDILKITCNYFSIWKNNGAKLAQIATPNVTQTGAPVIRDINMDGHLDFGSELRNTISGAEFRMYTFNKTSKSIKLLWTKPVNDTNSAYTGAITADLNGDGFSETLFADQDTFYIYASNGTTLYSNSAYHVSGTAKEYPLYVDIDNDSFGEIILVNNAVNMTGKATIVVLSARQKERWTPTTSVWSDWEYTFRGGVEERFVNSTFSPNWRLAWKDKNFFRGAINSCWLCNGTLDPFFLPFNPECVAQQWSISGQSTPLNTASISSILLSPGDHVTIDSDFILDSETKLTIIVSETLETGTLNITGSFIQNGSIFIDFSRVNLKANQTIKLYDIITSGSSSASSFFRTDAIDFVTKQAVEPCDITLPQQQGSSLSINLTVSAPNSCWICTGVLDPFFAAFKPECINRQWRISAQPGSNSSADSAITLDSLVHVSIESDFVLEKQSSLNILVSDTGTTGSLNIDGSFVQNGVIIIDMTNVSFAPNQQIELKQIINFGNAESSSIHFEQVQVLPNESVDPCFVQTSQIQEQHSLSLLVTHSTQKSAECESEEDNTDLIVGLTVGLVGGFFCIVVIVAILIVLILSAKQKRRTKRLASMGTT